MQILHPPFLQRVGLPPISYTLKTYELRVSGAAGPALAQDFPEVEAAVRIMTRSVWIRHEDKVLNQIFCLADPNILDVFTFPMLRGGKTALSQPQSVLITESAAREYFGDRNPIGEIVSVEGSYVAGEYTITGILRDVPKYSTLPFDFLSTSVQPIFTSWMRLRLITLSVSSLYTSC